MSSYTEWMRSRTSWRTYSSKKLSENDRKLVEEYIKNVSPGPFGNKTRFKLIDNDHGEQRISTYGFIRGAQHFIVGAVKKSPMSIEDYGYCLEKIILYVTGLGLGTCWLGGTFTRRSINSALGLEEDEVLPAITPVGYKNDRGLVDKVIRWGAGSRNRKPWSELFFVSNSDTPLSPNDAGLYTQALEMVRIAPSGSNGQPWRLVQDGDAVHFLHDDSDYSIIKRLDMGIAFSHFDLTMKEKGIGGKWIIDSSHNDPGYVATWKRSGKEKRG